MPTTDTNIWDYVVTYGGPSLFMTAVFLLVMPIAWFKLARPRFKRWPSRLAVMLAVWTLAWFIAYGDVLMIAREAKRLCETEAGLKVYSTAKVSGFAGVTSIREWALRGFSYVEYIDVTGKSIIYRMVNGIPTKIPSDRTFSVFEYSRGTDKIIGKLVVSLEQVRRINGSDVLGEIVTYRPQIGWVDRFIGQYVGLNPTPMMCEGVGMIDPSERTISYSELIGATLIPKGDE